METQFEAEDRSVVEFQLGNKQLLLLFLGLLVICAIFFFIGLRVGEDTARGKAAIVLNDELEAAGVKKVDTASGGKNADVTALAVPTEAIKQSQPARKSGSLAAAGARETKAGKPKTGAARPAADKTAAAAQKSPAQSAAASGSSYYIQVAAPTDESSAGKLKDNLSAQYPAVIQQATVNGRLYYRIRLGPYPSKSKAEEVRLSLLSRFPKAFLAKI